MFHWICPECGQEIAPGVKECPVCEPQASPALHSSSGLSAAPSSVPQVASPAPVLPPTTVSVPAPAPVPAMLVQPVVPAAEPPVPEPQVILQPEVVGKPEPGIISDAPQTPLPEPGTFADRLADLAERLHGQHIQYAPPRIVESAASASPRAEQARERALIIDVTPATPLLAPPRTMLLLAEPQPPSVAAEIPVREVFHPRPAAHPAGSHPPRGGEPSVPSGPGPVQLPGCPNRAAAPALAPLQDYHQAAERQMRPAEYRTQLAKSSVEPKVTLPGPALPRELMSLQAAGLVPIGRTRRDAAATNLYGWKARLIVLGILLTAGVGYWAMPGTSASAPAKQAPQPAPDLPVAVSRPDNSHSLARFVEVAGIRFVEVNKKPQIHYLVVNHSSAPLNSVTVFVTLRNMSAKGGQPPLARLTFRSPNLAAFEAKEMASPIERVSGPLDLPDWQDLRADVEVQ